MKLSKVPTQAVFFIIFIFAMPAHANNYVDAWGPSVGEALPLLEAYDHAGQLRTLENLVGDRGLLLFLNRSADW